MMSEDGHITSRKASSDTDSNSNSGSLFSRRYPDDLSLDSSGSKENSPSLSNNENSSSPKLQSRRTDTAVIARRRLLKDFFPDGSKCQPKMTREDLIDLATNEEKLNSDDEWFIRKIKPKSGTHFNNWIEKPGNSQVPLGATRADVQKFLMKRLKKLRRSGQEQRKALYDADNGIMSGGQVDDTCRLTDEKSEVSKWNLNEKPQPSNVTTKKEGDVLKYDLLEYEAAESYNGNKEVASYENEISQRKINLKGQSNEVNEEIAKEIKNIKLNWESKDITGSNLTKCLAKSFEETFDVDWKKNWLQLQKKTGESFSQRKNYARFYSANNETESSDMSDETTGDSEEGGKSSASLMDDLLDDVAANCSGIFEYPEEHDNFTRKILINGNDSDDKDDEDDELIREHRKPRKRRLIFSPSNSDEDEQKECLDAVKSAKNVLDLEADNRKDTERLCDDAVLNRSDNLEVNNRECILFDEGDHNRDVIYPNDASNEEDQELDESEETGSSGDELKVFHKLQIAQKRKKRFEYVEEEASLSGDDFGSDESDDEDQLNVYEAEEGDNDELPDNETIREQLHNQWLKQQQEEESRKLLYWKDRLLVDGDLADATDRTFRFKLRKSKSTNSNKEVDELAFVTEDVEIDDGELCKRRREISKWKVEQKEVKVHNSLNETNLLLKAASEVIDKGKIAGVDGNSESHGRVDASLCKNSLLHHRKSLSQVLNQTKITLYTKPMSLIGARENENNQKQTVSKQEVTAKSRNMKETGKMCNLLFNRAPYHNSYVVSCNSIW